MAFVKKTWKDRIAEFPTRRRLTKEDNTSELVTVAREEGTLSQEGDAFSAENMNDLENRIDAEFTELNGKLKDLYKQQTISTAIYGTTVGGNGIVSYNLPPTIPDGYTIFDIRVRQVGTANGWLTHVFCPDENYKLVIFNHYTSPVSQAYAIDYTFIKKLYFNN